jgi:hypothetical protein
MSFPIKTMYPSRTKRKEKLFQKLLTGYRPVVRARQGLMLGIRQPMDGPVFDKFDNARNWSIQSR